jgi:hypothetical protein
MDRKDPRVGKTTLLAFNVANAMLVGFALGRLFAFPYVGVGFFLAASAWGLALGVALAVRIIWREDAPRP